MWCSSPHSSFAALFVFLVTLLLAAPLSSQNSTGYSFVSVLSAPQYTVLAVMPPAVLVLVFLQRPCLCHSPPYSACGSPVWGGLFTVLLYMVLGVAFFCFGDLYASYDAPLWCVPPFAALFYTPHSAQCGAPYTPRDVPNCVVPLATPIDGTALCLDGTGFDQGQHVVASDLLTVRVWRSPLCGTPLPWPCELVMPTSPSNKGFA